MIKPKIRFKGYQEEWEQRKLGDMAVFLRDWALGNSVSWGIWQNLVKEVDILKVI